MILLLLAVAAQAGAWTREFGSFYTKAGADFYRPSVYYDPLVATQGNYTFFGQQYGLYGEFGVLKAWPVQVTLGLPLTVGRTSFEVQSAFGPPEEGVAVGVRGGDANVSVQTAILRGSGPQVSVGVQVKIPTYQNGKVGASHGVFSVVFPKPGDGQIDVTTWALVGGSIPSTPLWIDAAVGWRHRTEAFVGWDVDVRFLDGVPFQAKLGITQEDFVGMIFVDGIVNPVEDRYTRQGVAVGPAALVTLDKGFGVEFRLAYEPWTKNAARGMGAGIGVSWRKP